MLAWIPAMAEVVRAGEAHGMTHLMYSRRCVVAPVPDTFMARGGGGCESSAIWALRAPSDFLVHTCLSFVCRIEH
jgi:hypothetical protein